MKACRYYAVSAFLWLSLCLLREKSYLRLRPRAESFLLQKLINYHTSLVKSKMQISKIHIIQSLILSWRHLFPSWHIIWVFQGAHTDLETQGWKSKGGIWNLKVGNPFTILAFKWVKVRKVRHSLISWDSHSLWTLHMSCIQKYEWSSWYGQWTPFLRRTKKKLD